MATQTNLPFSWEQVDSLSDLNRLCLVLDALPDTDIINALGETRAAKPAVTAGLCASLLSVTVVFLLPPLGAACRGIALTGAATP